MSIRTVLRPLVALLAFACLVPLGTAVARPAAPSTIAQIKALEVGGPATSFCMRSSTTTATTSKTAVFAVTRLARSIYDVNAVYSHANPADPVDNFTELWVGTGTWQRPNNGMPGRRSFVIAARTIDYGLAGDRQGWYAGDVTMTFNSTGSAALVHHFSAFQPVDVMAPAVPRSQLKTFMTIPCPAG